MDILTFIVGFIIGVICVALAIELGMKKTSKTEPASRTTQKWSISEIRNPRIIAEYLGDVEIPKKAKVVVNQYDDESLLKGLDVKIHSGIKGNFILGDDRALLLAGPIKKDEIGVWTVEKEIMEKLNRYFEDAWSKGTKMNQEKQ
ncbi:MAG: hypothetical protein DRO67_02450 [Candidatus Asgardarchaeum californiense]|nr:MAG: hypothetical protein DRO67_02450 [Candidatus Asgardarchaeum californiense]